MSKVYNSLISDHSYISEQVTKTSYENGYSVLIEESFEINPPKREKNLMNDISEVDKNTPENSEIEEINDAKKTAINIPIVSYLVLKGKCAYCKKKIGFIYFLCEVLCATLFLVSYLLFGFTEQFFLIIILTCALIVTIVSDFLYYYISDRVLVISYISILVVLFAYHGYEEVFMNVFASLLTSNIKEEVSMAKIKKYNLL